VHHITASLDLHISNNKSENSSNPTNENGSNRGGVIIRSLFQYRASYHCITRSSHNSTTKAHSSNPTNENGSNRGRVIIRSLLSTVHHITASLDLHTGNNNK